MGLFGSRRRHQLNTAATALYRMALQTARDPYFYTTISVEDTLDGRFDILSLHVFLLIHRLNREPAPDLAQALFDTMFRDMDIMLREVGVGDNTVRKHMRNMWEAFHGRAMRYEAALADTNPGALETALAHNVWRGTPNPAAKQLARLVRAQVAHLAREPMARLATGETLFLPIAEALVEEP